MREIVFAKYSNERCERFAIKTLITSEEGKTFVEKYPLSDSANAHVCQILKNKEKIDALYGAIGLKAVNCYPISDKKAVKFDYIEGMTFTEKLENIEKQEGFYQSFKMLESFKERLISLSEEEFLQTENFCRIFGEPRLPSGLHAANFCCFDLAFDNIIEGKDGKEYIIDYEWCFDFPVPIEYIFYRALKIYVVMGARVELIQKDIYGFLGFDKKLCEKFDEMETAFQSYVRGEVTSLRDLYESFEKNNYNISDILTQRDNEPYAQIYFDRGGDYSEEDSFKYPAKSGVELTVDITNDIKALRLDPLNESCAVAFERICMYGTKGAYTPQYITNGFDINGVLYFAEEDPMIIFNEIEEGAYKFYVKYSIYSIDNSRVDDIFKIYRKANELQAQKNELEIRLNSLNGEMTELRARFETSDKLANDREIVIEQMQQHIQNLTGIFENRQQQLENEKAELVNTLNEKEEYIKSIENSKAWKLVTKARELTGK